MNKKHKVIIRKCTDYDPAKIAGLVREGMQELGVKPAGRILLKPNVVIAHQEMFPHAFTRKEFLDGVLTAVKERAGDIKEIAVGERSGITVPTRFCFKNAGYTKILKNHGTKVYYFDESRHIPFDLKNKDRLRDTIYVPEPVKDCDFLINLPKFKAHPWCRLTLSLKNYIGLQDDRHRLVDHNSLLEKKIADLQEVVESKFIAVDAITAGQRMMLTPTPFNLGAIVMGTNSCAVDTVGCRMVNIDPVKLVHLKIACERGYGPAALEDIEVMGDFPLEEVQEKTKDFQFCLEKIDKYFNNKGNLSCTVGSFPEKHSPDYCWGGCPGALQEAMHIFKCYYPDVYSKMKKVRYVVGKVDEDIKPEKDERVIFAGNCTGWTGNIGNKKIKIKEDYKKADSVNVHRTRSNDMLIKIFSSLWLCFRKKRSVYIKAKGCPVSVAEHVNYISSIGKIGNVNFDLRTIIPVNIAYLQMRINRFLNRFKSG